MARRTTVDQIDKNILRILSTYEQLTALELWYEVGEDDSVKVNVTEQEIKRRLESLKTRGFVERIKKKGAQDEAAYLGYRVKPTRTSGSKES
jgi:DNA-binding Lrp family transcriptional regulator